MNSKTLLLSCALVTLSPVAHAQSSPPLSGFVRPSLMVKRSNGELQLPLASSTSSLNDTALLDAHRRNAETMLKNLMNKPDYALDEGLRLRLRDAIVANKAIHDVVREIIGDGSTKTVEINKLRLSILSDMSDVNPSDHAQVAAAQHDIQATARLNIMRLLLSLRAGGVTEEARNNAKVFLTELKLNLSAGIAPVAALDVSRTATALATGHEVNIDLIEEAASRPQEGTIALFKGSQDRGSFVVAGPDGKPLEINMTAAEGEAMEKDAWELAMSLFEVAKDPASLSDTMAAKALVRLEKKSSEAQVFLENNPILNKKSPLNAKIDGESKSTIESVDQLLTSLRRYDELVSGRGADYYTEKAKAFARSVPLLGRAFSSFEEAVSTERVKIQKLEELIIKSGLQLQENNNTLMDIKGRSVKIRQALELEIARVKIVSDYVLHLANQAEEQGDKQLATTLRSEIMQSLERKKNSAMTFHLVLGAADQAISQIVTQNNQLIEQASALRDTAIPIIAINQTLKSAGQTIKLVAIQQKQVRRFTTDQLVSIQEQMKENAQTLNEMAKLPLIEPEVLNTFQTTMKTIGEERTVAMAEAAVILRGVNDTLIQMMNDQRTGSERHDIGILTHNIVNGQSTAPVCAKVLNK